MGIYISNLKIPKDEYLPINIYPDGRVACRFDANCANAIELPPHGDLIDRDALKVSLAFAEKTAEWAVPALRAVLMVIDEMPTIIPADDKDINVLCKKEDK